ncbi:hypothetical protein QBC37DRAFT_328579 [Rhypophila decipiens]|uniref:Uncharacterized protein n=1 Tax=Rhypophila decipiens TaxID=261697 RepID=A0AAN7B3B0_9PEZI|nr:hypothetical protein QBC37DRAFT_328579 [Rhypophila decipiens]
MKQSSLAPETTKDPGWNGLSIYTPDSDQVSRISGESVGGLTTCRASSVGFDGALLEAQNKSTSDESDGDSTIKRLERDQDSRVASGARQSTWASGGFLFSVLVDYILITIAILFHRLGLGIGTLFLNNQPSATAPGQFLEAAATLGPSIFPILFAAIVGRSLRNIGRYRAQRNIRLATMYTLLNSTTMFETLHCQWTLRRRLLTMQGPFWILFTLSWALSPIGGQASLRVLSRQNRANVTMETIRYADNGPLGHMYINNMLQQNAAARQGGRSPQSLLDGPLESVLLQTAETKQSPADAWGNIKIPRLSAHSTNKTADEDGWFQVDEEPRFYSWASLLGLPILNMPNTTHGHANFIVGSAYISLECGPRFKFNASVFAPRCLDCQSCVNPIARDRFHTCLDDPDNQDIKYARIGHFLGEPFSKHVPRSVREMPAVPRTLEFQDVSHSACTARQESVDVTVDCSKGICKATKVRKSRSDKRGSEFTALDLWATETLVDLAVHSIRNDTTFAIVGSEPALNSRQTGGSYYNPSPCIVASFITQPLRVAAPNIMQQIDNDGPPLIAPQQQDIASVDAKDFEVRATILINTYIQLYMAHAGIGGDLNRDLSLYGPEHEFGTGLADLLEDREAQDWISKSTRNSTSGKYQIHTYLSAGEWMESMMADKIPFVAASTAATVTRYTEVYKPVVIWVTLLLGATMFLLAIGCYGLWLSFYVTTPDVFDPVMALTLGNTGFMTEEGKTYSAEASARVKEVGDLRVRIGGSEAESLISVV